MKENLECKYFLRHCAIVDEIVYRSRKNAKSKSERFDRSLQRLLDYDPEYDEFDEDDEETLTDEELELIEKTLIEAAKHVDLIAKYKEDKDKNKPGH